MKEIKNIDEVSLWHTCFPNFTPVSEALGVYTMRSEKDMLKRIGYIRGMDEKLKALLTLEMSCAVLWPYVEDLFCCDFFPHILAAATDILRATDFGESALITQKYLVQELQEVWEQLLLQC